MRTSNPAFSPRTFRPARGAPAQMEWYGAFGLMVTLVWLYLEILRLLARFNNRD